MKRILCYEDSNTWGFDTEHFFKSGEIARIKAPWPELLLASDSKWQILVDALNGRTTCFDDPEWPNRNGLTQIKLAIEKHASLDVIILMLGTNDLKWKYHRTSKDIQSGVSQLIRSIKADNSELGQPKAPQILIIAPYDITDELAFDNEFKGAIAKQQMLKSLLHSVAKQNGCNFFDCNQLNLELASDGIHLTAHDHLLLSEAISEQLKLIECPDQ